MFRSVFLNSSHHPKPNSDNATQQKLPSPSFTPPYNDEQTLFFSQRTDGILNQTNRQWSGEPAELLVARVALPKPRTIPKFVLGRYQERSRSQRIVITKRIVHPGEVNRIRSMPSQPHLIVTTTDSKPVFYWDTLSQPHRAQPSPDANKSSVPDLELLGHEGDCSINALDTASSSLVLSGGLDKLVVAWDIKDYQADSSSLGKSVSPRAVFKGHTDTVEDCCFRPDNPLQYIFCSFRCRSTFFFFVCVDF